MLTFHHPEGLSLNVLEQLSVGDERVVSGVRDRIRESLTSSARHHCIVLGPSGAGKTHAACLAAKQASESAERRNSVVWVGNSHTLVTTVEQLCALILSNVPLSNGDRLDDDELPHEPHQQQLRQLASRRDQPLVVVLEDIDRLLDTFNQIEQQRFRHLLQTDSPLTIVGTATTKSTYLTDPRFPFYEFFHLASLVPLSVEQARDLISRRHAIAAQFHSDAGHAHMYRPWSEHDVRLASSLAGSWPGTIAAMAAVAHTGAGVAEALFAVADMLTPQVVRETDRLSPQQRRVLWTLACAGQPQHVVGAAMQTGAPQRSVAKTLSELVALGFVHPVVSGLCTHGDKRRTYYEASSQLLTLVARMGVNGVETFRRMASAVEIACDISDTQNSTIDAGLSVLETALAERLLDESGRDGGGDSQNPRAYLRDAHIALRTGAQDIVMRLPTPIRIELEAFVSRTSV